MKTINYIIIYLASLLSAIIFIGTINYISYINELENKFIIAKKLYENNSNIFISNNTKYQIAWISLNPNCEFKELNNIMIKNCAKNLKTLDEIYQDFLKNKK